MIYNERSERQLNTIKNTIYRFVSVVFIKFY